MGDMQSIALPMGPWYGPLPPLKGSELRALILKVAHHGITRADEIPNREPLLGDHRIDFGARPRQLEQSLSSGD